METVTALAAAFALGLRNILDESTLAAIDAENAGRGDDSCASHDHLDANEVMADAFMAVMGHAPKASSEADAALINAAWDRAKATGFATAARAEAHR
jgi:predicted metal-binding membrane protein